MEGAEYKVGQERDRGHLKLDKRAGALRNISTYALSCLVNMICHHHYFHEDQKIEATDLYQRVGCWGGGWVRVVKNI
jgi:hypothetical protein